MTPIRSKRNSKTPNRFSSDNSRIETMNMNGETIIDYTDRTTSTTHSVAPMSKPIKLKPVLREPLKVKLPKLKRPCQSQLSELSNDTGKIKNMLDDIKIHKIKLPSLGSKKAPKKTSNEEASESSKKKKKQKEEKKGDHNQNVATFDVTPIKMPLPKTPANLAHKPSPINTESLQPKSPMEIGSLEPKSPIKKLLNSQAMEAQTRLDNSISSKANDSFSADTSISSEDGRAESSFHMEIVVSKNESPAGSGIRCPCGVDDDLGVMVECENCSTWQHGHCINVGTEEEAYEGYICAYCVLPQDKYLDSLRQLTVNDKYLSRFEALAELKRHYTSPSNASQIDSQEAAKVTELFSPDDLFLSLQDLQRVLNSLKVKWRILTSQAYKHELRIWQNANWCGHQEINGPDMNLYFIDRCKANLKLNISNMVQKLEERLQLINYALFLISSVFSKDGTCDRFNSLRVSCRAIAESVHDYKERLECLTN